jgi:hypothetical protein
MSGSIAGLLGALDQQQQQVQQPNVLGLLGNATQLLPTDPTGQLAAAQRAAAAGAQQQQAAATPVSALSSVMDWAKQQDQNVYGNDLSKSALATGAGFPSFQDPRLIQDRLAQIAQGTVKVAGVDPRDAQDELMRQIRGGGWGGWGGEGGGAGEGAEVSGQGGSWG